MASAPARAIVETIFKYPLLWGNSVDSYVAAATSNVKEIPTKKGDHLAALSNFICVEEGYSSIFSANTVSPFSPTSAKPPRTSINSGSAPSLA